MRRRDFITLLGGASISWPLAGQAQQPAMPVIGFLDSGSFAANTRKVDAFRRGLAEAGYVENSNVVIEFRWADAQFWQLRPMADNLVRRQVAVIVAAAAGSSALAAKAATSTIPIVIATGVDPVKLGLIASLNQPGGNITGLTYMANELAAKRLSLLRELVPRVTKVAYLAGSQQFELEQENTSVLRAAAAALGLQIIVLECRSDRDMETALAALGQRQAEALTVGLFPLAWTNRHKILEAAAKHKIPAIYPEVAFASDGGLMSYAAGRAIYRKVAVEYVGKILSGANPADLPIQRPTTFELVINLKAAKALDLEVPLTLLAIADEVIE
jgi:putative ABC transport system substrate-binding protein